MLHIVDPFNTTLSAQIALAVERFNAQDATFRRRIHDELHSDDVTRTRAAAEELLKLVTSTSPEDQSTFSQKHFEKAEIDFGCYLYRPEKNLAQYFFTYAREEGGEIIVDLHSQHLSPEYKP
jgi:hypothetical protein